MSTTDSILRRQTIDAVITEAKSNAMAFVEEFDEPLNPDATEWDIEAWTAVCYHYALRSLGLDEVLWPVYQTALIAETHRICGY